MSAALISEVRVDLKKDGNIELVYSNVTADKFREVMQANMPDYENTELLYGFMKRLENITEQYLADINKII